MKKQTIRTILLVILLALFLALLYFFVGKPMISFLGDPEALQSYIDSKGIFAYLVFGSFIVIQAMSTCIPGLPFHLAAGYVMGGFKGALICDLFSTIGNTIAFLIGRKFGRAFLCSLFGDEKLEKVELLIKQGNPTLIHIIFMLLPLPKDTYAWLGYYSEESLLKWIIITFITRFPHIFIYAYGGEAITEHSYIALFVGGTIAVIVYVITFFYIRSRKH
ncbi:TVP38/TMEM64 family protein [Butyrivibrio sp. VCD2006]|uniref:TVP38/TMEM64 family protein n=1 Tax=Butyrivibrio sp. VCD2006 TaxID=1280664 RepID=UPI00047CC986|nr:VTT domain-containing protein [Butyrivibrio sp. VCD2006]